MVFLVFSAFSIPLIVLDIAVFEYAYALPLYLSVLNLMFMYFAMIFFQQPVYFKDKQITEEFIKEYGITRRETEIINLILSGFNQKDSAGKLFISVKTVGNHIQNIYRKLEINSRMQLINLILAVE